MDRMIGRLLVVTPYQHSIGQQQGGQYTLAAPNAIKAMAAKLQDGAIPCCLLGNFTQWPGWSPAAAKPNWPQP